MGRYNLAITSNFAGVKVMELIGVVLIAISVATVAVMSKQFLFPSDIHRFAPAHFELPVTDSYNRLFGLLNAGQLGSHIWQVIETVAPHYIVAKLCYRDEVGVQCDVLVTFDVVEHNSSTTTVRWSGKFLSTCNKRTASKVEKLLDSWIHTSLIPSFEVPPSAMPTQLLDTAESDAPLRRPESRGTKVLIDAMLPAKELILKSIADPPKRSSDAVHFDIALGNAYSRIHEVLMRAESYGYKWSIEKSLEDTSIIALLDFKDKRNSVPTKCIVNFEFKEDSAVSMSILWSCKFTQWNGDASVDRAVDAINAWLNAALLPPKGKASSELYIPPSLNKPIVSTIKSSYPKEFAYRKLLPRLSGVNGPDTNWAVTVCRPSTSILARVEHRPLKGSTD